MSIFTMVMSILKTYWIYTASQATQASVDVQYNAIFQVLFGVLEQNVVIIMGCIPSIRHIVSLGFGRFSSLGSSFFSVIKKSRSKTTGSDDTSPSTGGYYDMEAQSTDRSDGHDMSKGSGGLVVAPYQSYSSRDDLVPDKQVRRTNEVSVSYSNLKSHPRGLRV
jgi:hypothetical protein